MNLSNNSPSLARLRRSRRGTGLLYIAGLAAVLTILGWGMVDGTLRSYLRTEAGKARAQAYWVAQAGIALARANTTQVTAAGPTGIQQPCGAGAFVCRIETDASGHKWIVSQAHVPAQRPRATETLRVPLLESAAK